MVFYRFNKVIIVIFFSFNINNILFSMELAYREALSIKLCNLLEENYYYEEIEELVNNGADVNYYHRGTRPLDLLICYLNGRDNLKILEFFLKKGVKLESYGRLALNSVINKIYNSQQRLDFVTRLIEYGADVNSKDLDNCNAYYIAYIKGYDDICKLLVDKGFELNEFVKSIDFLRAKLFRAIRENNVDDVNLICKFGLDLNFICPFFKEPPLSFAINNKNKEICRILLIYGANVNYNYSYKNSPLIKAVCDGNLDIVELLIIFSTKKSLNECLYKLSSMSAKAIEESHKGVALLLIKYGAEVNSTKNIHNESNLIVSIRQNNHKMVKILIENGAHIYLPVNSLALSLKLQNNSEEGIICKILEDNVDRIKKIKIDLYHAVISGDLKKVKDLSKKISFGVKFENGNNLLHLAVSKYNVEIFKFILNVRPDLLNKKNNEGKTSLESNPQMISHLLLADSLRFVQSKGEK